MIRLPNFYVLRRHWIMLLGLVVFGFLGASPGFTPRVSADTDPNGCQLTLYDNAQNGPNMPRFCNASGSSAGKNMRLDVAIAGSGGNSLQSPTSRVKIYSTDRTPQLTITGLDQCENAGYDTYYYLPTTYRVFEEVNQNQGPKVNGPISSSVVGGNCDDSGSQTINLSHPDGNMEQFGNQKYWVWIFEADMTGDGTGIGAVNSFRLGSSSGYIGFSSDSGDHFALQNRTADRYNGANNTSSIYIPMAADCSLQQTTQKTLHWFDDDSNNPTVQLNDKMTFYLYDQTTNSRVPLFGGDIRTIDASRNLFAPNAGARQPGQTNFNAEPYHRYAWAWQNVNDKNGIQFQLPFDSIYHDVNCSLTPQGQLQVSCTWDATNQNYLYSFSGKGVGYAEGGIPDVRLNGDGSGSGNGYIFGSVKSGDSTPNWGPFPQGGPGNPTTGNDGNQHYYQIPDSAWPIHLMADRGDGTFKSIDTVGSQNTPPNSCPPMVSITKAACDSIGSTGYTDIIGYAYDPASSAAKIKFVVTVNGQQYPASGNYTADKTGPSPGSVPPGHGFDLNPTDNSVLWQALDNWEKTTINVIATDPSNSNNTSQSTVTIPPCVSIQCQAPNLGTAIVNQQIQVRAALKVNYAHGDRPNPYSDFLHITVTNTTTNQTVPTAAMAAVDLTTPNVTTTSLIQSVPITFTPRTAGTYQMHFTWDYPSLDGLQNDAANANGGCDSAGTVGYAPYFNVKGGDAVAGATVGCGKTATANSNAGIKTWSTNGPPYDGGGSDLAALAGGAIRYFATSQVGTPITPTALAFANTPASAAPTYGGSFKTLPCEPDYYANSQAASYSGTPSGTINNFDTTTYPADNKPHTYDVSDGPLVIDLGSNQLSAGQLITLRVKGNVYINSDITYGQYDLDHVPRLNLYVVGNIYIMPGVHELHGLYVAEKGSSSLNNLPAGSLPPAGTRLGFFVTCGDATKTPQPVQWSPTLAETTNYGTCGDQSARGQLRVYGSVMADTVRLDRSHGSLIAAPVAGIPEEAAEVFQYTPELWLGGDTTCVNDPTNCRNYDTITGLPPIL